MPRNCQKNLKTFVKESKSPEFTENIIYHFSYIIHNYIILSKLKTCEGITNDIKHLDLLVFSLYNYFMNENHCKARTFLF